MEKVLKDAIAPNVKIDGAYPFEFKAPSYDNRTSSSMSAGNYYGIGFKTPVGREKPRGIEAGPIPQQAGCFPPAVIFGKEDVKG